MKFFKLHSKRGFSLVEVVLYVSLFSLMSVLTFEALFQTVRAFTHLRISRDINDSSVKIMERLTRDIKSSVAVDMANSVFGIDPGVLTLSSVSASGTPLTVQYIMVGNALHLKEGASVFTLVDRGSLLSSQTSVSGVLYRLINVGGTTAVKIELHITASRGSVSETNYFYDTVVLRGTY